MEAWRTPSRSPSASAECVYQLSIMIMTRVRGLLIRGRGAILQQDLAFTFFYALKTLL